MTSSPLTPPTDLVREPGRRYDVVIIGAGIVGLSHAEEAVRAGMTVAVVERSSSQVGASIRNFGHICLTPQSGPAAELTEQSRQRWLRMSEAAGFWLRESGTTIVAKRAEELAVLTEYVDSTGDPSRALLLDSDQVLQRAPVDPRGVLGGAFLPYDLQVDPREAASAISGWLATQGVDFYWRTAALGIETGVVHTGRGSLRAGRIVVATHHDIDELFPDIAEQAGIVRCRLHMARVAADLPAPLATPLFTGWSLLRYSGFTATGAAAALRDRLAAERPDALALDLNQMYTQRPDGSLIIGDTHLREVDASPFQSEEGFELLLDLTRGLFGVPLRVLERWQGIYASSPEQEFLIAEPMPGVQVVVVTTGIGMTVGPGLPRLVFGGSSH